MFLLASVFMSISLLKKFLWRNRVLDPIFGIVYPVSSDRLEFGDKYITARNFYAYVCNNSWVWCKKHCWVWVGLWDEFTIWCCSTHNVDAGFNQNLLGKQKCSEIFETIPCAKGILKLFMNQDTINRHEIKQLKEKINILESVWLSKAFSPQKRLHLNNFDEKRIGYQKRRRFNFTMIYI